MEALIFQLGAFFWIIWLALCIAAGALASQKGRSGFGLFALALFASPPVGLIVAAALEPDEAFMEKQKLDKGGHRQCPQCAEVVKAEANVCRYCHHDLPELSEAEQARASGGADSEAAGASGLKECVHCHAKMPPHIEQCRGCGTVQPDTADSEPAAQQA